MVGGSETVILGKSNIGDNIENSEDAIKDNLGDFLTDYEIEQFQLKKTVGTGIILNQYGLLIVEHFSVMLICLRSPLPSQAIFQVFCPENIVHA